MNEWFEVLLHLARHAHLDPFSLHMADAHRLGQACGQPVAAQADHPVEFQFARIQDGNGRVLKPDFDESHDLFGKDVRLGQFKGVHRPDHARHDLIRQQARRLDRRLQILDEPPLGAAHHDFLFLHGGRFRALGWKNPAGRGHVTAVKNMIGQILLEIVLGIELEHLPQIVHRHQRQFDLAEQGIAHPDRKRDLAGAPAERARHHLEMLGQHVR